VIATSYSRVRCGEKCGVVWEKLLRLEKEGRGVVWCGVVRKIIEQKGTER
jgi:hypothetical protein